MTSTTTREADMLRRMPPRSPREKTIVNSRVDSEALAKLDEIANAMRPQASRSQMVELAILEFVERHEAMKKKQK